MSTILLVGLNHFESHCPNFLLIFSTIQFWSFTKAFFRVMGIPKYWKEDQFSTTLKWKFCDIICLTRCLTFQQKIWYFLSFTSPPDASRNESIICLNLTTMVTEVPPTDKVSSANCKWLHFLYLEWSVFRVNFPQSFRSLAFDLESRPL